MMNDRAARSGRSGTWTLRLFVAEEPRARRAGDVGVLVASLVAVALLSLVAVPPAGLESELGTIIAAIPSTFDGLWRLFIRVLFVAGVVLVLAALVRQRWAVLRDAALATVLVLAASLAVGRVVQGSWTISWDPSPAIASTEWVPWIRLAVAVGAVAVLSPHLIRPVRRLVWWLITLAMTGGVLLGHVPPSLVLASGALAVAAAAAVHLLLGSSRGRPDIGEVLTALGALGVEVASLRVADRQRAGVFVLDGLTPDGRRLAVKVYGRDAYDTQLLTTIWRNIWFREPGAPTAPGRLQQVEHEAFLTLFASQAGVLAQPVVTAGLAANDDALLVLEDVGNPVGAAWTDSRLAGLWQLLETLHHARIAHGQVDQDHVFVDGSRLGLADFRGASVTHSPWAHRVDEAQALVTGVLAMGTETALTVARDHLDAERLHGVLPFLQSDLLTASQREGLRRQRLDVDSIRDEVADLLGVEPPKLVQLRRVTWGSLLQTALPVLAFFALASVVAGLDLDNFAASVSDASWWFVAVGVLLAQLPRFFQAVSALGASSIPVPMSRLYLLQLAQGYIAITIPGGAARIAMNLRFFQRHGLPPGSALAVGGLDSFAGFLSQALLFGLILTVTSASLDLNLDADVSSGLIRLVTVIGIVVLAAISVLLLMPSLRRNVLGRLRTVWREAVVVLRGLGSPRRLALLFGGNITTEVLFALALGAFVTALGYPVGLPELILINVTVSLLAGVLPIPGGIGVVEGGLMFGLARAGVPEDVAFAAALLFRAATFYLPPLWGVLAFRWLKRNQHL